MLSNKESASNSERSSLASTSEGSMRSLSIFFQKRQRSCSTGQPAAGKAEPHRSLDLSEVVKEQERLRDAAERIDTGVERKKDSPRVISPKYKPTPPIAIVEPEELDTQSETSPRASI